MCTISYIPIGENPNRFIVTDNRDESINRPAIFPSVYNEYNTQLFYPKDSKAGGTWMGVSRKKHLMCLMNGAFQKYEHQLTYRKSRGIVVKEILSVNEPLSAFSDYSFIGIEPFFALLFSWRKEMLVAELIWDGQQPTIKRKDASHPDIWSSVMTYSNEQQEERKKMFSSFLESHQRKLTPQLVWDFHHQHRQREPEGLIINRGQLQTTSISQFQRLNNMENYFQYEDLITQEKKQYGITWPNES